MAIEILGKVFYAPKEIADILQVSRPSVHKLVNHGVLESIRIGNKILVPEQSFDTFLKDRNLNLFSHVAPYEQPHRP